MSPLYVVKLKMTQKQPTAYAKTVGRLAVALNGAVKIGRFVSSVEEHRIVSYNMIIVNVI